MTAKHYKANYTLKSYFNIWLDLLFPQNIQADSLTFIPSQSSLIENLTM